MADCFLVLGNQLFPAEQLPLPDGSQVYMAEDLGLCRYVAHHKQKIVLFLAAMRGHAEVLRGAGYRVHYDAFDLGGTPDGRVAYEARLKRYLKETKVTRLHCFEIEDRFFESRIEALCKAQGLELVVHRSPMFLTPREDFSAYLGTRKKPFMAHFYQFQRKRLKILVDERKRPAGGKWSFDTENRKRLPAGCELPGEPVTTASKTVKELIPFVNRVFADHPGELSVDCWWLPTTRDEALDTMRRFFHERFEKFGAYEDAISRRGDVLFHSTLSVPLNLGLLTPREVVDAALEAAGEYGTPLNSLEGFVRQIIGWREFIRGIDREFGERQASGNFFGHRRLPAKCWTEGKTGIPPLDDTILKLKRYGWCHHIERLMILGNLMVLCEIEPREAYRFFMEWFVDSSDWVMGPNVYGMALFSDGGIFATKPYVCGSNYLLKMSDYKKGPWCDIVDGLYWRFIDNNKEFFTGNPRLSRVVWTLDRMSSERKAKVFGAAEEFLERATVSQNPAKLSTA